MGTVFLFDIDLTMIRTNRAGSIAMTETLRALTGIEEGFHGIEFGGRTDRNLLREALSNHGRLDGDFEAFVRRFKDAYLPCLARHLERRGGEVLPGVHAMLDATAALPGAVIGVATGNFRGAAEIKLRYFDLWERFAAGGFADDGEDRAELVAAAIARTGPLAGGAERVIIFGDSTHDIAAAKANGAVAVGVATGGSTVATLTAAGADYVFDDLSDPETVLRVLLDGPSR